jgi:hypothetical protein
MISMICHMHAGRYTPGAVIEIIAPSTRLVTRCMCVQHLQIPFFSWHSIARWHAGTVGTAGTACTHSDTSMPVGRMLHEAGKYHALYTGHEPAFTNANACHTACLLISCSCYLQPCAATHQGAAVTHWSCSSGLAAGLAEPQEDVRGIRA